MSARQLIRVEMVDGMSRWRPLIDLEHTTLCRQFSLDEHRVYFDLPSSARGNGSTVAGAGGALRDGRKIDGYVMEHGRDEPIGKITFAFEGEKFRDVDPADPREALRLG